MELIRELLNNLMVYFFILSLLHVIWVGIVKIIDIYTVISTETELDPIKKEKNAFISGNLIFFTLAFVIFYFFI